MRARGQMGVLPADDDAVVVTRRSFCGPMRSRLLLGGVTIADGERTVRRCAPAYLTGVHFQ